MSQKKFNRKVRKVYRNVTRDLSFGIVDKLCKRYMFTDDFKANANIKEIKFKQTCHSNLKEILVPMDATVQEMIYLDFKELKWIVMKS